MPAYDYIQGERFIQLQNNEDIYYRHTHEVNDFFMSPPSKPFVLISHNSDGKITTDPVKYDADARLMPDNLIRWYGQNVDVCDERIEPIPIGLENSKWFKRDKKIKKLGEIVETKRRVRNLVYLNLNIRTNPPERQPIYDMLEDKPYVTVEHGKNGVAFDHYLDNLYNHHFMVCPRGNGIGVHQPWESMYIGTIPIQKKDKNNRNWRELPVCWVDDWGQLEDEAFLWLEKIRIERMADTSKLNFSYWKDKINGVA
jgi:hypothetical protein